MGAVPASVLLMLRQKKAGHERKGFLVTPVGRDHDPAPNAGAEGTGELRRRLNGNIEGFAVDSVIAKTKSCSDSPNRSLC